MLNNSRSRRTSDSATGSAKTDTLVKLVLIFFISLLSFSVGTFVGKQFSDSQYKMAQLEGEETQDRDPAALDPSALEATPADALTEEDIASLEEEFSKGKTVDSHKSGSTTAVHEAKHEDSHGETHARTPEKESHEKHDTTKVKDMVAKAAETAGHINRDAKHGKAGHGKKLDDKISEVAHKVIKGETPVAEAKHDARVPSSVMPKSVANDVVGKFTVQVSAYGNEADAVEHTKALKEKGYSAFYIAAQVKGKTWFRVSVGTYNTASEAQEYSKKIIGGDIKSTVIQKIVQN